MPTQRPEIEEQAVSWVVRLRDGGAADWEAFTRWLEADPAHLAAYEEAALADVDAGDLPARKPRPVLAPEPAAPSAPVRRRTVIGWGVAAALVGAIGLATLGGGDERYVVATGAGEQRTVQLADGSRIDLNGSSRLVLDRDDARFARLDQGEALFTVVHDESRPFRVEAGESLLRDLGTIFNVVHGKDGTILVEVAEGAVRYEQGPERADLREGMTLRKEPGRHPAIGSRSAEAITGWREGRLIYFNATIADVAADLSRNMGLAVTADSRVASRRFTGVILLDGDPQLLFDRVSALLDVEARRSGEGWVLTGSGATP
jgi:transmembrane sensor